MKDEQALNKLLSFIADTSWDSLDEAVKRQAVKCFLDLAGVLTAGTKNKSSQTIAGYVADNYPVGQCTILATGKRTNLIGAAMANGMAANALDMDDGFSLLRGHPGAGFFGALISAAELTQCSYGEFLTALVVSYETSIRQGFAVRDFYKWDHSTGCYSAFGAAAGVGKLLGLSSRQLEMALSIADFIAPLNPAKRSCYYPSMNKDGVYWGQHAGAQAVVMAMNGITGQNPVILDDSYLPYIHTLGEKYYFFDLYIKFYSCCRWVHSPIRAITDLESKYRFSIEDISRIDVYSFGYAGTLYKEPPLCEDEAQYNIKYPIAAKLLFGDCGPLESSTAKMLDPQIPPILEKITFHYDAMYDSLFPARRMSRVELVMQDGTVLVSDAFEPEGDHNAEVSLRQIEDKISRINGLYASDSLVRNLIEAVENTPADAPFAVVLETIKALAITNEHPEIQFI